MQLLKNNKYMLKFKSKPWTTLGLQKSISVKNKLLKNFINNKGPILKEEFHTTYKKYKTLLSTLMQKSKKVYYDKYFETNWNNIKTMEMNQIPYFSKTCSFQCTNCTLH